MTRVWGVVSGKAACRSVSRSRSRQRRTVALTYSSSLSHPPWWNNNRDPFHVYCITLQSLRSVFTFIIFFDLHANPKKGIGRTVFSCFRDKKEVKVVHPPLTRTGTRTRTHVFVTGCRSLSINRRLAHFFSFSLPIWRYKLQNVLLGALWR